MAAPAFGLSEQNGASTGTDTDNITSIVFASVDLNSNTASLATSNPITAGNNSYEKYNRLKVSTAASNSLSAFGVYFSATAPTDQASSSSFITMKYAANPSYTAPVATASSVATSLCSADTSAPGTTITAPANTVSSFSGYFCQQMQTTSSATGGNVTFASPWTSVGYTYS